MMALFMKLMFFGPVGFMTGGVPLTILGEPLLFFATLKLIISDGDGLRIAFCWRGAGSIKPCLRHANVLRKDSDLAGRIEGYVEITCDRPDEFKFDPIELGESFDKVEAAHNAVQEGHITQLLYDRIVQAEGFNYVEGGVPYDDELRERLALFESIRVDWVHSAMQDGALTVAMHLVLAAAQDGYQRMEEHCKRPWRFPASVQAKSKAMHRIFNEYRTNSEGDHDKLRATASECLGVYTLLRHFAESELVHEEGMEPHVAVFRAICRAIDVIQMAKKGLLPMRRAGVQLKETLQRWLQLHKALYGERHIKPKFHWMFDVAEVMADGDELVMDQFVIERLHLLIKPHAERIDNLRVFEKSVLKSALNAQLSTQALMSGECCLTSKPLPLAGMGARLASHMSARGTHIAVDDLVFHANSVGRVAACAEGDGMYFLVVRTFRLVEPITSYSSRWRATREVQLWLAEEVEQDLVFPDRHPTLSIQTRGAGIKCSRLLWACASAKPCGTHASTKHVLQALAWLHAEDGTCLVLR